MIHRRNLHLLWNVIKWNVADLDFSCFLQSRQLKKVNCSCVVFNHYTIKHTHISSIIAEVPQILASP